MAKLTHVIWDWNGTLFDDVEVSIKAMNKLLRDRSAAPISSKKAYQDIFCFPVVEYYKKAGLSFDAESFEELAGIFVEGYQGESNVCKLHINASDVLYHINKCDIKQIILSATQNQHLADQMKPFNITKVFEAILGLDNFFAHSKKEIGQMWMTENNIDADNVLLIGDTLHDFEVASVIGCHCILIANGHQSRSVLEKTGCQILDDISEVVAYLDNFQNRKGT